MATNPSPNPRASIWAWMAYSLRFQRSQRGLSGEALGRILNCSKATVSRLESGQAKIDEKQAAALDKAWDTGGMFSIMLWYARLGHDPDWMKQYVDLEAQASVIRIWQVDFVPGLLQTPDYARASLVAGGVKDVDGALEARMARQQILGKETPPHLFVLLFEGLLEIPVGGPEVMRAQLERLIEVSYSPNIAIRVVPKAAGAHPGLDGAFMVLSVDAADVGYVEAPGGGRLVLSAPEVRSFLLRYERIGQEALPASPSRDLIKRAMEAMQ